MNAALINSTVGNSRNKARIWIEGEHLAKAGIKIGETLYLNVNARKSIASITPNPSNAIHKIRVSKRTNNNRTKPLVEIRHDELDAIFGIGNPVRIIVKGGKIVIRLHHLSAKSRQRLEEIKAKIKNGQALSIGSCFHGAGTLDSAFHDGLAKSNIKSSVLIANEKDSRFLNVSINNNPHLWSKDTLFIHSPIESINLENACSVDIVLAGIPCLGASLSGRAKNQIAKAEEHQTVGSMFYYLLNFIQQTNPAVILLENVSEYMKSASFAVILDVLRNLHYKITYQTLNGNDFGALEARERLFIVATTEGLDEFDFKQAVSDKCKEPTAAAVLETLPDDSDRWRTYDYLDKAEAKAAEKGNGFKRSYIKPCDTKTNVIKRTNHKCQTDGIFVQHPANPNLSRLPSAIEHAKLKTVPERIIKGLSETLACELLGQGVIYTVVEAIGSALGRQLHQELN